MDSSKFKKFCQSFDSSDKINKAKAFQVLSKWGFFKKVMRVCENLPKVDFWIPTSRDDILNQFLSEGGAIPKNTTVRLSAPNPGFSFHEGIIEFYSKWENITFSETTTDPSLATCHASLVEGSSCGDCEDCFKPTHKKTVYAIHGKKALSNMRKLKTLTK